MWPKVTSLRVYYLRRTALQGGRDRRELKRKETPLQKEGLSRIPAGALPGIGGAFFFGGPEGPETAV
jgi:hypothetical protein